MAMNINPITNRELPYYPFYSWFFRAAPSAFWPQYPAYYFGYPYSYPALTGIFQGFAYPWMFRYIGRGRGWGRGRGRGRGFGRFYWYW